MRTRRICLLGSTLVAILTLMLGLAVPASAAGANYVALGDSYSSGVGAGSYITSSGSCDRSTKAYPSLWAAAHAPASFAFVACSGAKSTDVTANQLSALSTNTTLVSISVGGNDVGFAGVMADCNLYGTTTCVNEVNAAENVARTQLPGWLNTVYSQIRTRAPNARVVVLSYPRFYDLSAWWCPGLSGTSRSKINEGADVLDGVTKTAAANAGFSFADVRAAFANGHEICDYNKWLHSIDWTNISQSYHPNADGQSGGYLPAFTAMAG
ncbi:MAG: SGNH/GDSL hydrolase family protein [Pseudonocardiales bacterium]